MGSQNSSASLLLAVIFDSDIAIWMLRGDPAALKFARGFSPDQRLLSVISQLELLQGCRDQREQRALEELLGGWFGEITPLDAGISRRAVRLMREFGLRTALAPPTR